MSNNLLESALQYIKHGLSVIPLKGEFYANGETEKDRYDDAKKALVKWQRFQKELPSEDQIKAWWGKWPNANIGIVTGVVSGLAVIDIDESDKAKEALQDLIPDSLMMKYLILFL